MTTQAQIRANRANALRSTGPRTAAGKARSSLNGLKHGLRSHLPVPETPEFKGLRAAFQMEWRPSSPEARLLVETLAIEAWRFRYIDRLMEIAFRDPDPIVVTCKIFTLVRHWTAAANHFFRAVRRLDALPTGTDPQDFHDRTQMLPKFITSNQLRPKCVRRFNAWRRPAPLNAVNPRLLPLKPHFPAHHCRIGPARSP